MGDVSTTLKLLLLGEDKSASKSIKGVGDALEETGQKGQGFSDAMAAIGGAAIVGGVVAFGKASVESAQDAEKSQRLLEGAYARFPAVADVSIDKMRELNEAIQDKNGADADDIAASQSVLAQYGLTGKQIAELTPLMVDYAAKTGKDMPDAAAALGKGLLGSGKAMKELGIDFKDAGSVAGNFDQIMGGLKDKVGGFADSEAGTLEGQMKKLQTAFGDVQEEVGGMLLPVLTDLAEKGGDVVKWALENKDVLIPLVTALGIFAGIVGAVIAATKVWTTVQAALNVVMSLNPLALVVIAIAALVAALVVAYQKSETFRNIVNGALAAVGDAGRWLWENALKPAFDGIKTGFDALGKAATWLWENGIRPAINFIIDGFIAVVKFWQGVLNALAKIPGFGWAADAARSLDGLAGAAQGAKNAINGMNDKTVTVTTRFITVEEVYRPRVGGSGAPREFAAYALGGRPNVGELALFGEQGPELWIPDRSGTVLTAQQTAQMLSGGPRSVGMAGAGGGDVYITVQGDSDPLGAARRIQQKLLELKRTTGGTPLGIG